MKINLASTQLGVNFRVSEYEDADILALVADPTKLTRVTDAVNADRRQKVALVDARYDLSEKVDALGFKRLTETVTKDGESTTVPSETEGKHIKRFVDALVAGSFTTPGFTLPSGDEKVKENGALAFLQDLAYTCGDKTDDDGKPVYVLTLDKTARKAGTGLIPKWAMEAATTIIKNGNQAPWLTKFTNGYTTNRGIVIDGFVPADFQQTGGTTPEEKQNVYQSNVKNLAKAIVEVRRQENEKTQVEFA